MKYLLLVIFGIFTPTADAITCGHTVALPCAHIEGLYDSKIGQIKVTQRGCHTIEFNLLSFGVTETLFTDGLCIDRSRDFLGYKVPKKKSCIKSEWVEDHNSNHYLGIYITKSTSDGELDVYQRLDIAYAPNGLKIENHDFSNGEWKVNYDFWPLVSN